MKKEIKLKLSKEEVKERLSSSLDSLKEQLMLLEVKDIATNISNILDFLENKLPEEKFDKLLDSDWGLDEIYTCGVDGPIGAGLGNYGSQAIGEI